MAQMTQEQYEEKQAQVRELYEWYADDDNSVCKKEHLANLLRCIGFNPTEDEVQEWETKLGLEESEEFTWEVLWEHIQPELHRVQDEHSKLRDAFKKFDSDDSGKLDVKEFKKGMKRALPDMDMEELEEFFKVLNTDGDDGVDYEEFASLLAFGVNLDN